MLLHWFELAPLLDVVEALLEVFQDVGLDGFELVAAANSVFSYVPARGDLEDLVAIYNDVMLTTETIAPGRPTDRLLAVGAIRELAPDHGELIDAHDLIS